MKISLLKLSLSYIRRRKLNTFLNVLLLALGIATIVVLLLFSRQFEDSLTRNARGIDMVVGAKGSPLQLILSSIYHLDVPTGNISLREASRLLPNRAIRQAIPLALGDSYRGYRIVGTTPAYPTLYAAELAAGSLWQRPLEAVAGAAVAAELGLRPGVTIVSDHGFSSQGDHHGDHPLTISGILAPSGTVLDRLILTGIPTIWKVHEEGGSEAGSDHDHEPVGDAAVALTLPKTDFHYAPADSGRDITSLLIRYSAPMAAATLPRLINARTPFQSASPAFETARLYNLLGVGVEALQAFGIILIVTAALSIFIALYNALKERRYDLAMMRSLGASRAKLGWHVMLEGLLLSLGGALGGLLLGHLAVEMLGSWLSEARQINLSGTVWLAEEVWLLLLAAGIGIISALLPAIQAYRSDISGILAER